MKKMKKLLSLVLAMMLVLAMGSTAMAAETGTITIDNAIPGQTYTIYKMFNLESYNNDINAFSYKVADGWQGFVDGAGSEYVEVNKDGYVVWKNTATGSNTPTTEAFAKAALAYAQVNNIEGVSAVAPEALEGATTSTVTFEDLALGYYLLDSTTGALCSLDTTNPDVTIEEKNEIPPVEKEVKEDYTDDFGKENTADIGDVVDFQATITTKKGIETYKYHDKMSDGLTFNPAGVAVTLNGEPVSAENYVLVTEGLTDGCTFEVEFTADFIKTLAPEGGQEIVISYKATINENAIIGDAGNENKANLEFGNNGRTEDSITKTYVFEMGIYKYTGTLGADDEEALAGAVFELRRTADGDPIQFVAGTEANTYRVATPEEIADTNVAKVTAITTDATGKFNLSGLDADTYYLVETAAPAGYNLLKDPIEVVITQDEDTKAGVVTVGGNPVNEVGVQNNTGAELPSTGGIGTTIFYVLGGILVIGAGIMLVVRKRMSSEK